jgi:HEAT repeat protein
VASVFGSSFYHMPDKQKAWNNLHKLLNDEDNFVRKEAVSALSSAFPYLPDKQLALNDLRRLLNDEDDFVRIEVVSALGNVFPHVTDKQLICNDLDALIDDEDSYVSSYANHSLGKVSIFKASQTEREQDYRKELEKAICFFEKAALEFSSWSPSQFCLPFYRSFYTIIFKKQEAKKEVDKYLEEAKAAIEGSQSKALLFEAVQNLAKALSEVQSMENLGLQVMN